MAKKYLFAGGKKLSFRAVGNVSEDSGAPSAYFDPAYSDSSLSLPQYGESGGNYAIADFIPDGEGTPQYAGTGETLWVHARLYPMTGAYIDTHLQLLDEQDRPIVRIRSTSGSTATVGLQVNTGTLDAPVWVSIGGSYKWETARDVDFAFKIGTDGTHLFTLYCDRERQLRTPFSTSLLNQVSAVSFHLNRLSQVLITTDIPTVGAKVHTLRPTALGASTAWEVNAPANINEAVGSDAAVISSTTVGARVTYAYAKLPTIPEGLKSANKVFHAARIKNDGSAPLNVKPVIRKNGVDTVGANFPDVHVGYEPCTKVYDVTPEEFNAAGFELGWETAE